MSCNRTMVADPSAISWGAIGNLLAIGRRLVGDCILSGFFYCGKCATFWRSVGNWSAISRRLKTVSGLSATAATARRSVANQSATCRQPPKTFLRSIWSQSMESHLGFYSAFPDIGNYFPISGIRIPDIGK